MFNKGRKHTQAELDKMRDWHRIHPWTDEHKEKQRQVWLGRKHTDETKKKMSDSAHKVNLVGERFGRLVVTSFIRINKNRQSVWMCKCDCGNDKKVTISGLEGGTVNSCGCLRRETMRNTGKNNTIGKGLASRNSILYGYKSHSKERNLSWELTNEEFFDLISKDCHYCGSPPTRAYRGSKTYNGEFLCNGVDRIDSNLGYIKENCVPCCKHCNYAKRTLSYSDFLNLVKRIYENLWLSTTHSPSSMS